MINRVFLVYMIVFWYNLVGNEGCRLKKIGNVLWGIVLIVLGLIFGLNALEITNINIFFDGWWTLFIIIPSFIDLFNDNDKTGSIIGLIVGGVLLLCCQDLLSFELVWKLLLPVILVIIGLSMIFKDFLKKEVSDEIKKLNKNNKTSKEYCAAFSGQDINFENEEFKGANVSAVFGGIKLDLRKAIIKSNQVINASSIFGGIEILVPDNVRVVTQATSVFGGTDNKCDSRDSEVTLYINSTAIFGGVEIK